MNVPKLGFEPTVPVLLRHAAERYGSSDLVVSFDRRLSFAEAAEQSAALAKSLLAAGVNKGSRVGVMLPSSPEWVVTWLALARIGAMSLLFSTTYRSLEIAKALQFGDVELFIAPGRMFGRDMANEIEEAVPGLPGQTPGALRASSVPYLRDVWLDGTTERDWARVVDLRQAQTPFDSSEVTDEFLFAVEEQVSPADILTVVYTSGSSADPKAVMHTQGAAVRKVAPGLGMGLWNSEPGRVFMAMPMFWIGGPQSVLGALHCGSSILCQEKFDAAQALELMERERASAIGGWPAMLEKLRDHPDFSKRDLSSLVEPPVLPQPPDKPVAPLSSRGDPVNAGMTETFGPHRNRAYFDYKVIDRESGKTLPDGVEGEFCVRGFGLMAGMYRREREEVFDDDGYYHTGDRGYIEDGAIYFTGRYSEMIKTGGANVAPLEVETVLLQLNGVSQAYVFGLPDRLRGEEVAAVLVPEKGIKLDADDVCRRLREILSAFKVPTRIHVIDAGAVPYLGSGKPDKRTMKRWAMEQQS